MFQTEVVQRIKTHILYSKLILENHTVYDVMWKDTVEPDRPQMTIYRMHTAFRMT
jgi:hypothetical protein